jgi:hypothetical protein
MRRRGVAASFRRRGVVPASRRRCVNLTDHKVRVAAASNRPLKTGLVAGADCLIGDTSQWRGTRLFGPLPVCEGDGWGQTGERESVRCSISTRTPFVGVEYRRCHRYRLFRHILKYTLNVHIL